MYVTRMGVNGPRPASGDRRRPDGRRSGLFLIPTLRSALWNEPDIRQIGRIVLPVHVAIVALHWPQLRRRMSEERAWTSSGLRLAGYLRDATGRKIGFTGLFEADRFGRAESYLRSSPFYEARLYERAEALEFSIEVGALR